MTSKDFGKRAFDHSWKLDPIIRTLMDTDFYKFLMQQMIVETHPATNVTFVLKNRSADVRLADVIPEEDLRAQLDHARTLRFQKNELIWLTGNTFYGEDKMFKPAYIEFLKTFQLPEYELTKKDGQYEFRTTAPWAYSSAWEMPVLSIINELRARHAYKSMSEAQLDILFARAKSKLWEKVERLRVLIKEDPATVKISDFGTRRRHGFLWQRWCIETLMEGIGPNLTGTSNVKHAMDLGLEAIGTNAHELPMVYAALAKNDEELLQSPYKVLEDWGSYYGARLRVILPDTFGTTAFLRNAPDWVADWTGLRPDSKAPKEAVREYRDWLRSKGRDLSKKIVILSDGMDEPSISEEIRYHRDKVPGVLLPIGWGTTLTNDFRGCTPVGNEADFKPISLVCKVSEVDGRPAVKLSDNPSKAMGDPEEVKRYLRVFGGEGLASHEVIV
jgi:nicotinate phosphoribosyltransferase